MVIARAEIDKGDIDSIAARFHPEHSRLYGYSLEDENTPIEIINMRLLSVGETVKPKFTEEEYQGEDPSGCLKNERKAWLPSEKKFETVPVFDGALLRYGNKIEGPAIIEQVNTTTLVSPEYCVLCDKYGSYSMYLKTNRQEIEAKILKIDERSIPGYLQLLFNERADLFGKFRGTVLGQADTFEPDKCSRFIAPPKD